MLARIAASTPKNPDSVAINRSRRSPSRIWVFNTVKFSTRAGFISFAALFTADMSDAMGKNTRPIISVEFSSGPLACVNETKAMGTGFSRNS